MIILYIFVTIYLFVGLAYALYVVFNGIDKWFYFPINVLFGPVAMIYNYYKYAIKKDIPR